jgi:acyl-CoA reductase-like NAD-dependent aldehyde dehydrogenase
MDRDDDFLDKAVEGLVLFACNKGEVCTSPSRALVQEDIYEAFMARCLERIAAIKQGDPLDTDTQLGPQVSAQQIAAPTRWAVPSRPVGCGRTATTSTRLEPRSADTRSRASVGRTTG